MDQFSVKAPLRAARSISWSGARGAAYLTLLALALTGCAQQPQQSSGLRRNPNTGEYFPEGRYGTASPRVVADGEAVPRGGGRYLVGKPYKIAGRRYFPREVGPGFVQTGRASWYGDAFHGRKTANGEVYDMSAISAAHPTMPLPSYARVTNMGNGRSIIVRVNDRGPYHGGRVIDLSKRVADALDFRRFGTANVKVEYVRPAGLAGSDDKQLIASLRTDGSPASFEGGSSAGTMLAAASPQQSAPQRAAEPPASQALAMAAAPTRQDAPLPQATAAVQPAAFRQPEPEPELTSVGRSRTGGATPLPPVRPLDLATIPGAAVPIAAPPRRPTAQGNAFGTLTFFAPADRGPQTVARRGSAFEHIATDGVTPLGR